MGTAAGRIVARFFRKGCSLRSYTEQDWDEHVVDRQKFVLLTLLLAFFILGGLVGSIAYNAVEFQAILIPAGVSACLGTNHLVFCLAKWESLQETKKQEEQFTRQISQALGNEGPQAGDADADRMQQFIRQMSGKEGQAKEGPTSPDQQPLLKP